MELGFFKMFWRKQIITSEAKLLSEKISDLNKKLAMQEIDIALLTDRLMKAVTRKAIKKVDPEEENEETKKPVLVPI